jgi:hypothetical protein
LLCGIKKRKKGGRPEREKKERVERRERRRKLKEREREREREEREKKEREQTKTTFRMLFRIFVFLPCFGKRKPGRVPFSAFLYVIPLV